MDDPFGLWLLEGILLILVFLFSLAHTALKNANENKLTDKQKNSPRGEKLLRWLDDPRHAVLSLRGLKLFLQMMMAVISIHIFRKTALPAWLLSCICCFAGAFICTTFCKVLAERVARRRAERLAYGLFPLMEGVHFVCWPITWLSRTIARGLMRMLGLDPRTNEEEVTQEEIMALVDIGEESGVIESDEHEMLKNVFDFGDQTAADCMTHRMDVTAIALDDTTEEILETIRESGLSRFPVYEDSIDDVVGVLATRDFLLNLQEKEPKPLKELLREACFVPETVPNDVLLRNMQQGKNHLAIVVDEYGGMAGIITLEDLLEEIVGNIYDEFDPASEAEMEKTGENEWLVSGTADVEMLEEEWQLKLPGSEDYDTLGGLIFSRFSLIPEDGTTPSLTLWCTPDGEAPGEEEDPVPVLHIQVEKIEERRVEKARIVLEYPEDEEKQKEA